MDRDSRGIIARDGSGLTVKNIGSVMALLEANYGSRLYKDADRKNVIALWSAMFAHDDPAEVLTAVKEYMEEETFPPTVADIKKIIRKNRQGGSRTSVDEIMEKANRLSAAHGMQMTDDLRAKNAEKVAQFKRPVTAIEIKIYESREEAKGQRFLK